jgi:RNA polymerase sigma-70 factor, ECF subfamily
MTTRVSYADGGSVTHIQNRTLHPSIVADFDDELSQHHRAAFGWALACCRWDRTAAEDVLHTAYLKLMDGRARYDGHSQFRTFLFGVIRRTASEERRRRAVRDTLTLAALRGHPSAESLPPTGLAPILRAESTHELITALDKLSARQREVLHLVFYQDLTIAEAADVLGVSIGSARAHYERGKAQLRRLLGGNGTHAE